MLVVESKTRIKLDRVVNGVDDLICQEVSDYIQKLDRFLACFLSDFSEVILDLVRVLRFFHSQHDFHSLVGQQLMTEILCLHLQLRLFVLELLEVRKLEPLSCKVLLAEVDPFGRSRQDLLELSFA